MQEQIEQHEIAVNEVSPLEKVLQQLWERAHSAAEIIASLRSEKNSLEEKVRELEITIAQAQSDVLSKNVEVEQLRAKIETLDEKESSNGMMNSDERTEVREKIRILIEKINAYL